MCRATPTATPCEAAREAITRPAALHILITVLLATLPARFETFSPSPALAHKRPLDRTAHDRLCNELKYRGGSGSVSAGPGSERTSSASTVGNAVAGPALSPSSSDARGSDDAAARDFERVKNIRDLSSVRGSEIVPGRVFRTGYLSEATVADAERLRDVNGVRTLVSGGAQCAREIRACVLTRGRGGQSQGNDAYLEVCVMPFWCFVDLDACATALQDSPLDPHRTPGGGWSSALSCTIASCNGAGNGPPTPIRLAWTDGVICAF